MSDDDELLEIEDTAAADDEAEADWWMNGDRNEDEESASGSVSDEGPAEDEDIASKSGAEVTDDDLRAYLKIRYDSGCLTEKHVHKAGADVSINVKCLFIYLWLEEQQKLPKERRGYHKIASTVTELTNVPMTASQGHRLVQRRLKAVEALRCGRAKRLNGGGRHAKNRTEEAKVAEEIRAAHDAGTRCPSRATVMERLGHKSTRSYKRFLRDHNLSDRVTEIAVKTDVQGIKDQITKLHDDAAKIGFLFKPTYNEFVQIDEIALTLSGRMSRNGLKTVGPTGTASITPTCDLDDHRKIATGVFFLSDPPIPPLVVFRGGAQVAGKWANEEAVMFSPSANMVQELMTTRVFPHIFKHNPKARVLVFDSARCHVTQELLAHIRSIKKTYLIIPAGVTSFVQALDCFYFQQFRLLHARLVDKLITHNGVGTYRQLTSNSKRLLLLRIVEKAHELLEYDVQAMFSRLGYVSPTAEAVRVPHLPDYTVKEFDVEAWARERIPEVEPKYVTAPATLGDSVADLTCTPLQHTQEDDKTPVTARPVVRKCTCGHNGTKRGPHKSTCDRNKADETKCMNDTKPLKAQVQKTLISFQKRPRDDEQPLPTQETERQLFPADNSVEDVLIDTIRFPDEEVTFAARTNDPQDVHSPWDCYRTNEFISSREVGVWVSELACMFPDYTLLDSIHFNQAISRSHPYRPRELLFRCSCIVFFSNHFVCFSYCPRKKQ